jgi:hypothetical protein
MAESKPCKVKGTGECGCLSHMGDTACVQEWPEWTASTTPVVEPPAEARQMAAMIFGTYAAYVEAGFTEEQAMRLILGHIASSST